MKSSLAEKIRSWLLRRPNRDTHVPGEMEQARRLIEAIDRGGVPLTPLKINQIARGLGLEVSRKARPEDTIQRIRDAIRRAS